MSFIFFVSNILSALSQEMSVSSSPPLEVDNDLLYEQQTANLEFTKVLHCVRVCVTCLLVSVLLSKIPANTDYAAPCDGRMHQKLEWL